MSERRSTSAAWSVRGLLWEERRTCSKLAVERLGLVYEKIKEDSCLSDTVEKTSPLNPGIDLKYPSCSSALRSMTSSSRTVAHLGFGVSAVEITP